MSIRPLPEEAVHRLKSSIVITTLNEAVVGLVKNSLDASADKVNVSVDYSRGNFSVEDDGLGIESGEFGDWGGLGKLHHTSRYPPKDGFHGSRGDFIASLATLSLITITSRHHGEEAHSTITMRNSNVLSRSIPAPPEHRLRLSNRGTKVVVRDLFGLMAVRVKQRPSSDDKASLDKGFSRLVRAIAGLVIAWPRGTAVSIRDTIQGSEVRFRPSPKHGSSEEKLSARLPRILVQSGLAGDTCFGTWVSVGASAGDVSVSGCVSLNAVATRRAQFISLGVQPLTNDFGFNVLYDEVNRIFANSDFACYGEGNEDGGKRDRPGDRFVNRELKTRKTLERWPMFYFRVDRSAKASQSWGSLEEVLDQPRALSNITGLLKMICFEFLKKHHFRPEEVRREVREENWADLETKGISVSRTKGNGAAPRSGQGSRSSTPLSRPVSPFDSWQRIKVGRPRLRISKTSHAETNYEQPKNAIEVPPSAPARRQQELGSATPPSGDAENSKLEHGNRESGGSVPAEGPGDHSAAVAAARTSTSPSAEAFEASQLQPEPEQTADACSSASQYTETRFHSDNIRCQDRGRTGTPSDWLKGVLDSWENPVFQTTEPPIPRIGEAEAITGLNVGYAGRREKASLAFDLSAVKLQGRLSKSALLKSEVVSQVDKKYILVKMPTTEAASPASSNENREPSLMVIVDQHAADERCQLEDLMRNFFEDSGDHFGVQARTEELRCPLGFDFHGKECDLLQKFASHFAHWGILYRLIPSDNGESRRQRSRSGVVEVVSLPPSILERGRTEPKLVADLLRNEIWKLDENGGPISSQATRAPHDAADWVTNFQGCPQGILDMLNSRSCRSAIMFNDVLDHQQSEDLVRRLGRCAFPFQCAHGRPAMAPLLDLESFSTAFRGHRDGKERYEDSFGRRMRSAAFLKGNEV